jgi:hypothetical protein
MKYISLLLVALLVGCTINRNSGGSTTISPGSSSGGPITTRSEIFSGSFNVAPREIYQIPFDAPSGGRVVGNFKSDSNIIVNIVDDENYQKLANQEGFRGYYNSGKIGASQINVTIPSGHFYVVFSNNYSIISTKHVSATLSLEQ